ncbi:Gelatinase B [Colletotrichum scovillei]|uniref:Gelatinase B n=1 Tax=Colletotrichum scovillei TaxID=1209932 RepID=A0A9P7UM66_9PEZI|nr:Gelatinase B [Colletotrichum scovillei]KAG7076826.1 Gelatinase B [Colletotrichum scovillei]KAG7083964.1 Gelatinase B [Colletotrichum scovillei]
MTSNYKRDETFHRYQFVAMIFSETASLSHSLLLTLTSRESASFPESCALVLDTYERKMHSLLFFSMILCWAAWEASGQVITLTPSTIDRARTVTVTRTETRETTTTATTTATAVVTSPTTTTLREVSITTALVTQIITRTTTAPCSALNCPKVTSTGTICKSCFVAQCTTTSSITKSCGCPVLSTASVDFECEEADVCNKIGCRTVYAVATPVC